MMTPIDAEWWGTRCVMVNPLKKYWLLFLNKYLNYWLILGDGAAHVGKILRKSSPVAVESSRQPSIQSALTQAVLNQTLSLSVIIMHHILRSGRNHGVAQLDNKLHSVKPVIGAWPVMPMRRT
ncbi:hypothetical protein TNCV_1527271 [Trichonephila clavipes]|nr:hypothetical protein TNCV_1527271 [Trichonephila clavipes]